ncbi:MAG: hypothetical protein INQ03_21110 [Candidatus Heimdallarchaeota archaeon]|nr:hypothetical protein [Candidatus Heimdallarchaeota archaeon]
MKDKQKAAKHVEVAYFEDYSNPELIKEKVIAGLIILYREISQEQLLIHVNSCLQYRYDPITQNQLQDHLRIIQKEASISFTLVANWIKYTKHPIRLNFKFHQDFESHVEIIHSLLGYLRFTKQTSIRSITQKFNRFGINEGDSQRFLALLSINGIIDAYINDTICEVISVEDLDKSMFSYTDQLIYGVLKINRQTSLHELANLLQVDKKHAEQLIYEFSSSTELHCELSRGGDVYIDNLPQIPNIQSINNLDQISKKMIGYLQLMGKTPISTLQKLLQLDRLDILKQIYQLVGLGIINEVKITNDIEIDLSSSYIYPEIVDETNTIYNKLQSDVSIDELAKELNLTSDELIPMIGLLVADGHFPGARIINGTFSYRQKTKPMLRFNCTCTDESTDLACPSCGAGCLLCNVCKGYIQKQELVLYCPHCQHSSHKDHILAWLDIKGICPTCRQSLNKNQVGGIL